MTYKPGIYYSELGNCEVEGAGGNGGAGRKRERERVSFSAIVKNFAPFSDLFFGVSFFIFVPCSLFFSLVTHADSMGKTKRSGDSLFLGFVKGDKKARDRLLIVF